MSIHLRIPSALFPRRLRHGPTRRQVAPLCGLLALFLAAGCATPVGVERADPQSVHRELTGNVLSTGELSEFTQNVLRVGGIVEVAEDDPAAALATIHDAVITGIAGPSAMFAYAELAFKHASEGGGRPYYLASAVYAFAYLFPEGEGEAPSPFDPRYRWAVELYNRAVTKAFETADGARVELRSGVYELPFGRLDVAFDQRRLVWGDLQLTEFAPAAEFEIRGLRNRYRRPGLGAPLAAATSPINPIEGFQVAARQRAPVTAVLRIDDARRALADGQLHGILELYTPIDPEQITIAGRAVPLEVEPTASLAYGLNDAPIWETEYAGFLFGDLLQQILRSSPRCSRTIRAVSRSCWCTGRHRAPHAGPTSSTTSPATRGFETASSSGSSPTRPAIQSPIPRCSCARRSSRRWHRSILQVRI